LFANIYTTSVNLLAGRQDFALQYQTESFPIRSGSFFSGYTGIQPIPHGAELQPFLKEIHYFNGHS